MTTGTISIEWLRIDLGHLSTVSDSVAHDDCEGTGLTDDQQAILDSLTDHQRTELGKGGFLTLPSGKKDDHWVASQLHALLTIILGPDQVSIGKGDVVLPSPSTSAKAPKAKAEVMSTSPNSGTHCRLVGTRWVNERTYRLYLPKVGTTDRNPWLMGKLTTGHVATATLVWVCRNIPKPNPDGGGTA